MTPCSRLDFVVARVNPQHRLILGHRLGHPTLFGQRQAEVVMGA